MRANTFKPSIFRTKLKPLCFSCVLRPIFRSCRFQAAGFHSSSRSRTFEEVKGENTESGGNNKHSELAQSLRVELVGARELPRRVLSGLAMDVDPYCKLQVGILQARSSVKRNTTDPLWGEVFYFPFHPESFLRVTVYDEQLYEDSIVGCFDVQMQTVAENIKAKEEQGTEGHGWHAHFVLQPPKHQPSLFVQGRVYINFTLVHLTDSKVHHSAIVLPKITAPPEYDKVKNLLNPWCDYEKLSRDPDEIPGPPKRPYRILALDGGGVRGVLTSGLLARIVDARPDFFDSIDLIAGTSTGGLLATLLATGYSPRECQNIYRHTGPHIFSISPARRYSLFTAKYNDKLKHQVLTNLMGGLTLGDLKKYVTVLAFKLDGTAGTRETLFTTEKWRPAVFCNLPKGSGRVEPDNDLSVVDAAMRTSAAPVFFPVYQGYIDGAIFANNPSFFAISKVLLNFPVVKLPNITVFSLGAGSYNYKLNQTDADWGMRQWGPHFLSLFLDSQSVALNFNLDLLLGKRYHRLNPMMPHAIGMDAVEDVGTLVKLAEITDLTKTLDFLDKNWFEQQAEEVIFE